MTSQLVLSLDKIATPLGDMLLVVDDEGRLRAADFADYERRMHRLLRLHYGTTGVLLRGAPAPALLRMRFAAYFDHELGALDDIEVTTRGTEFQREVWAALRTIPAGTTCSYAELATRLNRPRAVRAVGLANGANPVCLVVPCHRVIGAKKQLTGYGGGLERKRWLLEHEGALQREVVENPSPAETATS